MSAFIVGREHIDALVAVAVRGPSGREVNPGTVWHGITWQAGDNPVDRQCSDYADADALGLMLWSENLRSIHARYPDTAETDSNYPGPVPFSSADVAAYVWPMSTPRLSAVAALKALDCYEYQSCEHADWTESEAYRFCDALRRAVVGHLPGYDAAEWEVTGVLS